MGNLKTFVLTCLGVGLATGAGFYLYRKFTSVNEDDQNTENSASQGATQEASENDGPTTEDLDDVSKNDTAKVRSNETRIEVKQIKEDTSSLQNGVDKQREDATRNQTKSQKTPDKKYQTKKSKFGGLKKGFLL